MTCPSCQAGAAAQARFCAQCGAALSGIDPRQLLIEATRIVAGAGPDLNSTLDALTEQACRLLGAEAATLQLATGRGDELEVRRPSALAAPGSPFATPGTRFNPGSFTGEAIRRRSPMFTGDYQRDPRHDNAYRPTFTDVVASMVVPLFASEQLVGTLYLDWSRPVAIGPREIEAADAFGQHAAIAIRTARLLEESHQSRSELEAILDGAHEAIAVYAADGHLQRLNRGARDWLAAFLGRMPQTLDELVALAKPREIDGRPFAGTLPTEVALRGELAEAIELVESADGELRRILVRTAPVAGEDGDVRAIVILWRDITDLHAAIEQGARLDGAIKTVRRVAHELGNQLAPVAGYSELLVTMVDGEAADLAARVSRSALGAAATLQRLQSIIRFEESEFGGQVMLDLDAATSPPADD